MPSYLSDEDVGLTSGSKYLSDADVGIAPVKATTPDVPLVSWGESAKKDISDLASLGTPGGAYRAVKGVAQAGLGAAEYALGTERQTEVPVARAAYHQQLKPYIDEVFKGDSKAFDEKARTDPVGLFTDLVSFGTLPLGLGMAPAKGAEVAAGMSEAGKAAEAAKGEALAARIAPQGKLLSSQQISAQGATKMNTARNAGISIKPTTLNPMLDDMESQLKAHGFRPEMSKNANVNETLDALKGFAVPAYEETAPLVKFRKGGATDISGFSESAQQQIAKHTMPKQGALKPLDFNRIQEMHELIQDNLLSSADRAERKWGMIMKNSLKNYESGIDEGHLFSPEGLPPGTSAKDLAKTFIEGREEYHWGEMGKEIEHLFRSAGRKRSLFTTSGERNATVTKFRQLAERMDKYPSVAKKFTPEMREAIEGISKGGDLSERFFAEIGRFSPRGAVPVSADIFIGSMLHAIGGPPAVMAAGFLGRRMATTATRASAQRVLDLAKVGGRQSSLDALKGVIGDKAYGFMQSKPVTAQAVREWSEAAGKRKKIATTVLASTIARHLGTPTLVPRIIKEIDQIDTPGSVNSPKPKGTEVKRSGRAGVVG